jgi:hypothetical protein
MTKWFIAVIAMLFMLLFGFIQESNQLHKELDTALCNIKAYNKELSSLKTGAIAYQFTIDQLNHYQDSILQELNETRKNLKIKDKNLKALQYVASSFSKTDTIMLKDTIFKEPAFSLDTIIGDEWYKVKIGMKYPSTLVVNPKFKSKKHITVSSKRETVNPPKKFFLFRLFQKKHTVVEVNVVEKDPYVENEVTKYIEIIK